MSKVTLALGFFIIGACSAFIMSSGSHISTVVQRSSAFAADPSPPTPPGAAAQSTVSLPDAIPIIPNLGPTLYGSAFTKGVQQIDGLQCLGCSFNDTLLTYGGGAYDIPMMTISGPIRLELSGAALNTLRLLLTLKVVSFPIPSAPPAPADPPWLKEPNPKINISVPKETIGKTFRLVTPISTQVPNPQ